MRAGYLRAASAGGRAVVGASADARAVARLPLAPVDVAGGAEY